MRQRTHEQQFQAMIRELAPMRSLYPGRATPRWLEQLARTIWDLETTGATGFGGPDVLAWWLVQRATPRERMTKAKRKKLIRMAGRSQKALDLMVAVAEDRAAPARMQRGWPFEKMCSYVSLLKRERTVTR